MYNRIVLSISIPILLFLSGCSYKLDPGYEIFMVRFTNNSTSAITGITLQMNGSEDVIQIADLSTGQTTAYQQFLLPDTEGNPQSWGDYYGEYTQKNTLKSIFIMNYDHKFSSRITVVIDNAAYSFVSP